jgi:hypothetical protein
MTALTHDLRPLIGEAWDRARRRRWAYAALLALLLTGAGIWAGLALTGGGETIPPPPTPPGYHAERARGPVQHAVVALRSRTATNGYPLGKATSGRAEVWFDRGTDLVRERGRFGGGQVFDQTHKCACKFAFPEFSFDRYWPIDTTKFVRRPGIGTFHGRDVIWLGQRDDGFAPAYRNGEWFALDPRTHDPVAWRLYGTTDRPTGQVIGEAWVVKRFADIAPNRFWFVVRNKPVGAR